ncbi:MAG: MBL fold metallo-hydrolase [Lachnospiraceae bacterium]|nr:MBL fold metallo-hydrolase [Lachnospiraceae bacterium]
MRAVNLIENTKGHDRCAYAHGLSFYVETSGHKLLVDLGPTDASLHNAKELGIDLTKVDTVVLSHGHYDHSGGIMPFARINSDARIYMQKTADADYYADDGERGEGERYRYIGIDKAIAELPQAVKIKGDHRIDDELDLFTIKKRSHDLPFTNKRLLIKENGELRRDDFVHEQYLVISEGDKKILISGCAHNGILSILDAFKEKYGAEPDMVISGFHLMKKTGYTDDELRQIISIGTELMRYSTKFVTCHCTGETAYEIMKNVLGDQLQYVHSGENVEVKDWT